VSRGPTGRKCRLQFCYTARDGPEGVTYVGAAPEFPRRGRRPLTITNQPMTDTTTDRASTTGVALRDATPDDIPTILALVRELAEYERDPEAAVATPELLYAAMFAPGAVAHAVMAEDGDEPLGFALYFFNFSTWTGRPGLYLEDFYVRPFARGRGIGTTLFRHLARIARERGCGRMELSVLTWNLEPMRLYERLGGQRLSNWTTYRFDESTIAKLAGDE